MICNDDGIFEGSSRDFKGIIATFAMGFFSKRYQEFFPLTFSVLFRCLNVELYKIKKKNIIKIINFKKWFFTHGNTDEGKKWNSNTKCLIRVSFLCSHKLVFFLLRSKRNLPRDSGDPSRRRVCCNRTESTDRRGMKFNSIDIVIKTRYNQTEFNWS